MASTGSQLLGMMSHLLTYSRAIEEVVLLCILPQMWILCEAYGLCRFFEKQNSNRILRAKTYEYIAPLPSCAQNFKQ